MTPKELLSEWSGTTKVELKPFYYLSGEEEGEKNTAVKRLLSNFKPDPFNFEEFSGESCPAEDIVSCALTPPMMSSRRILIVRRGEQMNPTSRKALAKYLENPLETTCLVLLVKERKPAQGAILAAVAQSCGGLVQFWPLREWEAVSWITQKISQAGFRIRPEAARTLSEKAGRETSILETEVGKLIELARGQKQEITEEQVLQSLGFFQPENIFELGRALEAREASRALLILENLLDSGENPFQILYHASHFVSRQLKARRLSQAGCPEEEIYKEIRLTQRYNPKFVSRALAIRESEIRENLTGCLEVEGRLKSNPAASPRLELKNLLLKICRGG